MGSKVNVYPCMLLKGMGQASWGDWLRQIRLDWKSIGVASMVGCQDRVEALLDQYPEVFEKG